MGELMSASDTSWLLFAIGCFGLWLSGVSPKAGWRFAIASQILAWLPYSIFTQQWGMAAMSVVFVGLYAKNLWRWRNSEMRLTTPERSESVESSPERVLA